MLIIICRCWPLIHPFIYLFWRHVCAHLDGLWNLKQRGKIPSFWGTLNSLQHQQQRCTHTHKNYHAHTRVHIRHVINGKKTHAHIVFFYFLLSYFLQVVLEYLRCVIRHPFPSELERKKEILDRKVYKKKPLWIFDILCTAASKWVGWRGKEKPTPRCVFSFFHFSFFLPFFPLSSFREMEASARPQLTHPCIERLRVQGREKIK